jgi:hypothetical protein
MADHREEISALKTSASILTPTIKDYRIDKVPLTLAVAAEIVIISTSFVGQWLLSDKYATNLVEWRLMMLAPTVYAVIEMCRVPLVVTARIHRSKIVKVVAILGTIAAALVTVKSVSQMGQLMFWPRVEAVNRTARDLALAQDRLTTLQGQVTNADAVIAQRIEAVKSARILVAQAEASLAAHPGQHCGSTQGVDHNGNAYRGHSCLLREVCE